MAWSKGTIGFGLVSIPVSIATAATQKKVPFRILHKQCMTPRKSVSTCPQCAEMLDDEDLVRGYEFEKGSFVEVDDADLEALWPEENREITVVQFVTEQSVERLLIRKTYFLSPGETKQDRARYKLLMETMIGTEQVAVVRYKEQMAVVRPDAGLLVLEDLFWADEIRQHTRSGIVDAIDDAADSTDAEKKMAGQLVKALSGKFDHSAYVNEYGQQVEALLQGLVAGHHPKRPELVEEPKEPAPDLMDALKASVAEAKKSKAKKEVA